MLLLSSNNDLPVPIAHTAAVLPAAQDKAYKESRAFDSHAGDRLQLDLLRDDARLSLTVTLELTS